MRKRIGQIARGKFEYAKPLLSFSEEFIDLSVTEGKDEPGSFSIKCNNQMKIRGIVYSTNPRMECLTPQFEGEEVRIRYQFHSEGLVEGEISEGSFVIVCNQCEYSLSFCAKITKLYAESSIGVIKNLYDFSCLAKENWQESYQLFYNKNFENIINVNEVKERMIYKGIVSAKPSNQNLEEFLIGIQKKKAVEISVDKNSEQFLEIEETVKSSFTISKDNWGYVEIRLSTDCDFIRLSKPIIFTDDFIGSTYEYDFIVDYESMHEGKNFGRIYIKSAYQSYSIDIVASRKSHSREEIEENTDSVKVEIEECKVGIMELYQAYRLKRIVTGVWANETIEILNHLHALDPDEYMYVLMKAQAYIVNRQRQEAEWILDDFKREWADHKAPIWGYYLYLMTLMEREPIYVDKMTHEIELIFYENPDSKLLFWVLLFLQEQYYNNNSRKLKAIEYWVLKGCSSPYFYLEAYYLIWQDPYLLNKLDKFQIRILRWAIKQHALTKEIASQIFEIVEVSRSFDKTIFRIMCAAYETNPKPEYIGLMCSYLIKGQQYQSEYHEWYEKGIELELRITGLYEAFLLSMDERKVISVPKIIQMYFQYDSTLSYKNMAVLYNNIIAAKDSNVEVYQKYRRAMGKFAMEQVELGHMDDNLAVLYEDMLDLGLVNEELAKELANIIFTCKLVVFDRKMVRAIIYQRQIEDPQIVPIVNQAAYFQLFSNEYVILFEDEKGQRYVGSVSYRLQKLMETEKYINKCIELAPDEIAYIISVFNSKQSYLTFTEEDKQYFPRILFGRETSSEYKAQMAPEILKYYQTCQYDEIIKEFLAKTDFDKLTSEARKYLLDMLVWNRMYDVAYELIQKYGIDQISTSSKVTLAVYEINKVEEADDFLLGLVEQTFLSKKYNDTILTYMCKYYNGPTDTMIELWHSSRVFEIETFELEERIINQLVYVEGNLKSAFDIFINYYKAGGRDLSVLAYLSACAHEYFVDDCPMESELFDIIENRYICEKELNDACKLALLKHLSTVKDITLGQYKIEDELLSEFTCRNMNFAFYKKLDRSLILKYHFYDKVFLQYKGKPGSHVVLHYSRDEDGQDFIVEDMIDVYDGIYVRSFVMFFGEMIQYYISEELDNKVEVTESNRLSNNDIYGEDDESRYNLINQIIISNTLQDETSMYRDMKQYVGYNEVTKQIFKLL